MEWFNGTFKYTDEKLAAEYPVVAAHGLQFSADGKQMAIVNDFPEGSREIDLSDPKVDTVDGATFVFYHVFSGEDAAAAKQAIEAFLPVMDAADNNSVKLLRREPDRLFQYADGHICLGLLREQDTLREKLLPDAAEDVFILPLKLFMHKCPVCGYRTLPYRDYFFDLRRMRLGGRGHRRRRRRAVLRAQRRLHDPAIPQKVLREESRRSELHVVGRMQ